MIEQAKALIERSFSEEVKANFTEGTLEFGLNLCINAGGFAMTDDSIFAAFRYWPSQGEAVQNCDWYELERMNLRTGPLLHVVLMICPTDAYRLFRAMIRQINVYGVTVHRWNAHTKEWRFVVRKNMQFRGVSNGQWQFRAGRQQEQ